MDENKHYLCSACGGVSNTSGVCQTEGCAKHQLPLDECTCGNPSGHNSIKDDKDCGPSGCTGCAGCGQ